MPTFRRAPTQHPRLAKLATTIASGALTKPFFTIIFTALIVFFTIAPLKALIAAATADAEVQGVVVELQDGRGSGIALVQYSAGGRSFQTDVVLGAPGSLGGKVRVKYWSAIPGVAFLPDTRFTFYLAASLWPCFFIACLALALWAVRSDVWNLGSDREGKALTTAGKEKVRRDAAATEALLKAGAERERREREKIEKFLSGR